MTTVTKPTFKAFLSHRYKSPAINERFFDALSAHSNLLFEVDVGSKATNLTRLERFVRDADAFVGIYAFPDEGGSEPEAEVARKSSQYFRLELDLAHRSRRPAIVFLDERYSGAIPLPDTVHVFRYDHREVTGRTPDRRELQLTEAVDDFCGEVTAAMSMEAHRRVARVKDRVGIILPMSPGRAARYSRPQVALIESLLTQLSLQPVCLDPTQQGDGRFLDELERLDWAVVDIGAWACLGGLPAYLHGRFIPQMRLLRVDAKSNRSPLEDTLLAPFTVGYPKDIIRWHDTGSLEREFVQRLTTLYDTRKFISDSQGAKQYFASAALKKEMVFLSYAGEDRDMVERVADAFRKRFQQVFDYRDQAESIVPGRHWIDEVFNKLSSSALGVVMLSPAYLASGNCLHEARHMTALADAGKLRMFSVKLREGALELPQAMRDAQYLRGWQYPTPEQLVEKIVSIYDRP